MQIEKYYNDLNTLHINTEENKSVLYAVFGYRKMQERERMTESGLNLVSGNFITLPSIDDVPEDFRTDGNTDGFDKIPVPSCWQTRGYDRHQYTNTRYPFPYNPPYVPYDNPCGAYVTHFESDNDYRKY